MISKSIIPKRKGIKLKLIYTFFMVIAMLAISLPLAAPAFAVNSLDQSQEINNTNATLYHPDFHTKLAQSFTPGVSGQLDKISVYLGNSAGSTSPVTAEIRAYSGGPNETILASTSVVVPYNFGGAWTDFVFSSPPSLTAGTAYAIVLTGPNSIIWYGSTDYNSYVNGAAWHLYTNGTSNDITDDYWTTSNFASTIGDFMFRTYRLLYAPTNITLSNSSVPEREPAGTTVGTFGTTDVDSGDSFTYTLVSGDGSADNASFTISGNTLKTAARFDYETKNSYSIRVRSTDAAGLYYEKAFTINVTYVEPDLELDQQVTPTTFYANLSNYGYDQYGQTFTAGMSGDLSKVSLYIDNTADISVTMQIQGVTGGMPNGTVLASTTANFTSYAAGHWVDFTFSSPASVTSGTQYALVFDPFNSLGTNTDYPGGQAVAHYSNGWVAASNVAPDFVFKTYVTEVPPNLPPTDISLSNSTVAENQNAGAIVGNFSTTDPNGADNFTYTLVASEGDTDNAVFSISGSNLVTTTMLDYETKPLLSVRVRTTDQTGLYYEKIFAITVTDVAPALNLDQQQPTVTHSANLLGWNYDQFGQTFTAGLSGNLEKASFNFYTLEPISVTVEIQAVTGGMPNGTSLASTTVAVPGYAANQWIDFTFPSPAYVTSGTQYAALLSPKFNSVGFNSSNTYSAGQVVARIGSSWTGNISSSIPDFAFKTYVIEATAPAPTYTVTYDGNGNTGGSPPTDSNAYYQGDTVTVLGNTGNLVKTGYTFAGWNTAANGSGTGYAVGDTFVMDSNNVTLYAQWTAMQTYTVTYDGNGNTGGSPPTDSNAYYQGDTVTVLGNTGNLEKTGYTFAGWNTATDGSGTGYVGDDTFVMDSSNVTLYAQWTALPTYTVNYDGNSNTGGSPPTDSNAYYQGDTVIVLGNTGNLEKTGYTFTGWNTAADGSGTGYVGDDTFIMGSSNVTLYAQWTAMPTYTVTYDGNGNTGGSPPTDSNAYYQDETVTVLGNTGNLTKTDYTFTGWNTAADGSGTSYVGDDTFAMGTSNVTLYAQWTAMPTYTVTYDGNGNTSGSVPVDSNTYITGATVTVLGNTGNLVKTGYTFAGWNTATDGSGTSYVGDDTFAMGSSNVTLYAQWTAMPTYTVTYDGNGNTGGSPPTDSNAYYQDDTVTVLGNTGNLVKTGYTFAGWNTATDGSGTGYAVGDTFVMDSSNVTLYAQWTINDQVPIITTQPQNTAVAEGEQASFTVEYTGFPEPAFQWQLSTNNGKRWNNIADANSDTYTTPAATSKMNGDQYRIILSNEHGSVTSEAATLTVTTAPGAEVDVSITKTGEYNPEPNTITWTIIVSNAGTVSAEGVNVTDNLAKGTRLASIDLSGVEGASYKVRGNAVDISIGQLANGASISFTITTELTRATSPVDNTAIVTTSSYDTNLDNNTDSAVCSW